MNGMNQTSPGYRNNQARSALPPELADLAELAELRRENLELSRELEETRLELRNAVQYALLVHSHQQSAQTARGASGPSEKPARAGSPPEEAPLHLKAELDQARAELEQLHRLLRTVFQNRKAQW